MNWRSSCPLATSHRRAALSSPAGSARRPAGAKATRSTCSGGPPKPRTPPTCTPRQQAGAVGSESHGAELLVPLEAADLLPGIGVPQAGGVVSARRGDPLAVRRPGHAPNLLRVPFQDVELLPRAGVPDPRRLV